MTTKIITVDPADAKIGDAITAAIGGNGNGRLSVHRDYLAIGRKPLVPLIGLTVTREVEVPEPKYTLAEAAMKLGLKVYTDAQGRAWIRVHDKTVVSE